MDVEVISPAEALKIMPQLSGENLYGAIYLPRDGHLDPYTTTTSMARFAKEMGVEIHTGVRVTGIGLSQKGEVQRVITDHGSVKTQIIVNAAGMWAPRVAAMAGLQFPTTRWTINTLHSKPLPAMSFHIKHPVCAIPITSSICVKRRVDW